MKNRIVASLSLLLLLSPSSSALHGATSETHVVRPGESIQDAVDAASPGDTIVVKTGTYRESVRISTHGLTLKAQGSVTIAPPHYAHGQCYLAGHIVGICVVPADFDPGTGSYSSRVRDVTITGFRIVGFEGEGVFGFGTEDLEVSRVTAIDNTAYGVASFDGIGTTFTRNTVSGANDAGIYIGDSLDANAVVSHNRAQGNAFGILVRHSQKVVISDNESSDNCLGVFVLADGQAGGAGLATVLNNTVTGNSRVCTQFDAGGFLPVLGGGGIVLAGAQNSAVLQNVVRDNDGTTVFSGGIVLVATPRANGDGSFDASSNNLVVLNRARGNEPADIVTDAASAPNLIALNRCGTSIPSGHC